jgi:peptidoglycan/xylan/chitin deacetylase (PgdA/CDA1 family)
MKTFRLLLSALLFLPLLLPAGTQTERSDFSGMLPSYRRFIHRLPPERSHPFFYRADTREKIVALTFDDGPLRRTPRILRLLKEKKAPAAFFLPASRLNARNARLYDDPLFSVGLHGYRHPHYKNLSVSAVARELDRGLERFRHFGLQTEWFRPPYGMVTAALPRLISERNLRGVLWSLDSYDWRRYRGRKAIERIRRHLRPGSVILLHDQSLPIRDLAELIDTIRVEGYTLVPLERLLRSPSLYP